MPFKMRHAYHARSCMKQARFFSLGAVASAATAESTEPISEALKQLNETLDKLEVLVVSK